MLDESLAGDEGADFDTEIVPGGRIRDVVLIGLLHDLSPVSAARLQWLLQENDALTRPVSAAARGATCRPCGRPVATCRAAAAGRQPASELEALFRAPRRASMTRPALGRRRLADRCPRAVVDAGRSPRSRMDAPALLERLTGENVLEEVRPTLIRHLAAHLDLGMSSWRNPKRAQGFYAAWRASAAADIGWELDEWLAAREEIARLPTIRWKRSNVN